MTYIYVYDWISNWSKKSGRNLSITGLTTLDDIIKEAVNRGYGPSVQNTNLKKGKYGSSRLSIPKNRCVPIIVDAIRRIFLNTAITQIDFDKWEYELATRIRNIYHGNGSSLYVYGNAQKWINMAIKFLYSSDSIAPSTKLFEVCYLVIDSIILNKARKLGVTGLGSAWSKCDDWNIIVAFEKNMIPVAIKIPPYYTRLWWECNAW